MGWWLCHQPFNNYMEHIRFEHVTKVFGSVVANNDISFSIEEGEILSILGENGSGKTTLLNVLDGIYQQDEGDIYVHGEKVIIKSPKNALDLRIGMVHQHFKLVDVFTALENIVLGLSRDDLNFLRKKYNKPEYRNKKFKLFDLKEQNLYITEMCERYGFKIDLNKHVYDMSVSEKQTLEIIKVLYRGVETLILDEPTAVLTPQEIKQLFITIKNMKENGKTVVIITHKLNEVMEVSDRVAVLRKGEFVGIVKTEETNESQLAEMMVGHQIDLDIHRSVIPTTGKRLEIKNLSVNNREGREAVHNVNFDVYGSEILGIAGISGSGQKELLEAISGLNRNKTGEVIFTNPKKDQPVTFFHKDLKQVKELASEHKFYYKSSGEEVNLEKLKNKEIVKLVNDGEIIFYEDEIIDISCKKPIEIRDLGIKLSFVPEDRLGMGLIGSMDLVGNMALRSYRKGKGITVKTEKPEKLAKTIVDELDIKTPSIHTEVSKLSGGNIQKVLVGRELASNPKVLMVAYPVRGLDINSSYLIYHLLNEQKKKGTAIIFVGEDLDVLMALSDRILVLSNGHISKIVDPREVSKEEIGLLMTRSVEA